MVLPIMASYFNPAPLVAGPNAVQVMNDGKPEPPPTTVPEIVCFPDVIVNDSLKSQRSGEGVQKHRAACLRQQRYPDRDLPSYPSP